MSEYGICLLCQTPLIFSKFYATKGYEIYCKPCDVFYSIYLRPAWHKENNLILTKFGRWIRPNLKQKWRSTKMNQQIEARQKRFI